MQHRKPPWNCYEKFFRRERIRETCHFQTITCYTPYNTSSVFSDFNILNELDLNR